MDQPIHLRLRKGRELKRLQHMEQEMKKRGTLRAGTSGLMSENGDIAAQCHRKAHLRQLGIEIEPPTESNQIMWELGYLNEDSVFETLTHSLGADEIILREEEIPTEWFTSGGTKVTGRPDMVICKKILSVEPTTGTSKVHFDPVHVLELKSVASFSTGKSVLFEREPKLAHLAQLAHYMWKTGAGKGSLVYKQYAKQAVPSWAARHLPKKGEPRSEWLEYQKDGKPGSVLPFELVYEVVISGSKGKLQYKLETEPVSEFTETIVSVSDILRFYEFVAAMGTEKQLGPRPLTASASGEVAKYWSMCEARYCPLAGVCERSEANYDKWLEEVIKQVTSGEK